MADIFEVFLTFFIIVVALVAVILFIACGWYLVWKLFLSKFKFVQELLGKNESEQAEVSPKKPRTKLRKD